MNVIKSSTDRPWTMTWIHGVVDDCKIVGMTLIRNPYFHIWCQLNPYTGVYSQETLAPDVPWCTPKSLKLHFNWA